MRTRGDIIRESDESLARQLVSEQIVAAVIVLRELDKEMAENFEREAETNRAEMEKEKLKWLQEIIEE